MAFVSMEQILSYIDDIYDYGTKTKEVSNLMMQVAPDNPEKHLIGRKTFFKYLNEYIAYKYDLDEWTNRTYLDYVRTNTQNTKAARYNMDDIKECLLSEITRKKLERIYKKKVVSTTIGAYTINVPKCVYKEWQENGQALAITGYTRQQLNMLGVPAEILIDTIPAIMAEIKQKKAELESLETQFNDMVDALVEQQKNNILRREGGNENA